MLRSPPSRRRGLKSMYQKPLYKPNWVASFAEAWIEIIIHDSDYYVKKSRLLRGGVD